MPDSKKPQAKSNTGRKVGKPLNRAIERYIRTIVHMRLKAARSRTPSQRIADVVTAFSGRMMFVYFHIVWFTIWILWNIGLLGLEPFDPFPYGLLTMIVSLEAIFLATFVLISQNRMSEQSEQRADLDLHIDLLTEYELTRVLQMLHAIQEEMGIADDEDEELSDLEMETKPEAVLAEIERMQERVVKKETSIG